METPVCSTGRLSWSSGFSAAELVSWKLNKHHMTQWKNIRVHHWTWKLILPQEKLDKVENFDYLSITARASCSTVTDWSCFMSTHSSDCSSKCSCVQKFNIKLRSSRLLDCANIDEIMYTTDHACSKNIAF